MDRYAKSNLSIRKKEVIRLIKEQLNLTIETETIEQVTVKELINFSDNQLFFLAGLFKDVLKDIPDWDTNTSEGDLIKEKFQYSSGVKSNTKQDVINAVTIRMNRSIGMKDKSAVTAKKILANLNDEELYEAAFQFAPITGLIPGFIRRSLLVYFCTINQKDRFSGLLRALLIDALNTFALPKKIKQIIINSVIHGISKETSFFHEIMVALNHVKRNEKTEIKNKNRSKIEYKKIYEKFDIAKRGGGYINELIASDKNLSRESRDYFLYVWKNSVFEVKNMNRLIYSITKADADLNSTPIAINGFLSQYYNQKDNIKGKTKNEIFAQIISDIIVHIEADKREVIKILQNS
ncbi:MAG: hypothetical protein DRG78_02315 [Epsilonproteobacteria bacterium]|nr:MAG: hypothetical protein DRG78_02315 [Campylobacterota bacterium]